MVIPGFVGGLVVAFRVDGELSEELAGGGIDDVRTSRSWTSTDGDYEGYSSGFSLGGLWLRSNNGTLEKSSTGGTAGFTAV